MAEVAELLVSELTTNAVQIMAGWTVPRPIRLRLSSDETHVLIEAWDADPRPPQPKTFGMDNVPVLDEDGRGLLLVATLSQRWGCYPAPRWGGKVVWCELNAQPDPSLSVKNRHPGQHHHAPGNSDLKANPLNCP